MNETELLKHARSFVFNAIPEEIRDLDEYDEASHFDVYVEWRSKDRWAVVDRFRACYNKEGKREHEPQPSSRDEDFLNEYRFSLQEAVEIAQRVAKTVKLNRFTVETFSDFIVQRKKANDEENQNN